jgi:FkbM family methyltransferase
MTDNASVGIVRAIAEGLLGPLVFTRHLPEEHGGARLVVSGRVGGLKYLFKPAKSWDPELLRITSALVKKNDIVWDVGANVGLFSMSAAHLAGARGCVYAIEADADAQVLLNRSIFSASLEHAPITLLPVAVSDKSGWATFAISKRARASNSLMGYGSSYTGGVLQNRTVPLVTLDELLEEFPPPNVLKIDVEGAELRVLEGAKGMLEAVRPLIYCEISSDNTDALQQIFKKYAYRFLKGEKFSSIADMKRTSNSIGFNTVAVPEEILTC